MVWLEDIWERGVQATVEQALEVAGGGTDGIYLSVDVDSLDGAFAPGHVRSHPGGAYLPRTA